MPVAEILDALGDPTRRSVLELLRQGPLPVGEVAGALPVSRPAVSKHLAVLAGAGLVTSRTQGRQHLYSVAPEGLSALQEWLAGFWDDALAALARYLEDQ